MMTKPSPATLAPIASGEGPPMAGAGSLRWLRSPAARAVFVAAMAAGIGLIALAATDYLDDGTLHPFIREKRATGRTAWWLAALGTHVVAALTSFSLCLLLLSRRLLRAAPRVHRVVGRVVGVVVLLLLVPSGFVLATTARGGFWGGAGFVASGVVMAVAMVKAIAAARRRDVAGHRRAVAHVIAQMSVAVISRALLVAAQVVVTDVDPDAVYVAALWLPVVGCALVAAMVVPARAASDRPVPEPRPEPEPVPDRPDAGDRHEAPLAAPLPRLQPAR